MVFIFLLFYWICIFQPFTFYFSYFSFFFTAFYFYFALLLFLFTFLFLLDFTFCKLTLFIFTTFSFIAFYLLFLFTCLFTLCFLRPAIHRYATIVNEALFLSNPDVIPIFRDPFLGRPILGASNHGCFSFLSFSSGFLIAGVRKTQVDTLKVFIIKVKVSACENTRGIKFRTHTNINK